MSLFPNAGPEFNDENSVILKRMEKFYAEAVTINQSQWAEGDLDWRFYSGDQSVYQELYGNMAPLQKKNFSFNRIRRIVSLIEGYQRRNRKSTTVVPMENSDQETADQFTKIMFYLNNKEGILETISNSFHGAVISGMDLLQIYVDYRTDPVSGDIKIDNNAYNSFLIDPFFRKADLSDCNTIWKRSYVTRQEAMSLNPTKADIIESIHTSATDRGATDMKFQFMPENYSFKQRDLLTYDEFYYRDFRKQKVLVDSQTGESLEWKSDDEDALREFLALYPQITPVEQEIPTVRVAIVVQGKVLYDGPNPLGIDQYPFVPVFAYYSPEIAYYPLRVQGVVRGLRDAQFLYNRRKVIELDILESQINSGFKYKENALVNPADIFLSGQGRGLALKEEASMADVEQIQPPQIPASMFQLSEGLSREIMEISGVNEELLGSADDDKAGILSMLRQGAGLTTLQSLFDQLDFSQKLLGKLIISTIQANYTPGKIKRILNEEPTQQFYNKNFGTYDCAIEEGANTSTQRQLQFAQLLHLREVGVPIPEDVLIKASTIQNKGDIIESMQARMQAQQQQAEQQAAIQMAETQARTNLANSRAEADRAMGAERISRIEENRALAVERISESEKDRMQAVLNMTKALKEMDALDLDQIQRLFELSRLIKEEESKSAKEIISNSVNTI